MFHRNSDVEALAPNVTVFGDGAFRLNERLRIGP